MTPPPRHLPHGRIDVVTVPTKTGNREFDAFSPAPLQDFTADYDAESSAYYQDSSESWTAWPRPSPQPTCPRPTSPRPARLQHRARSNPSTRPPTTSFCSTKPSLPTQQGIFCHQAISAMAEPPIDHQAILEAHHRLLAHDPEYSPILAGQYRPTALTSW